MICSPEKRFFTSNLLLVGTELETGALLKFGGTSPRYQTGQYDAYLRHTLSADQHEINQRKAGKPVARKRGRPAKYPNSPAPAIPWRRPDMAEP